MSNLTEVKLEVIHPDGQRARVSFADLLEAHGLKDSKQPAAKAKAKTPDAPAAGGKTPDAPAGE